MQQNHYELKPMTRAMPTVKNITAYRVIYGDTDQMGIVYYANYLRWFERGRSEFLRQIGLPYGTIEAQGFHFPVTEVHCRYANSARYDDVVLIETELIELGRASLSFVYRILHQANGDLLATGSTKHACIDRSGKVTRIPNLLKAALKAP
jgi:acyl-CoA thioester hydrolase